MIAYFIMAKKFSTERTLDGSTSMSKRKKIVREYINDEHGILCSAPF